MPRGAAPRYGDRFVHSSAGALRSLVAGAQRAKECFVCGALAPQPPPRNHLYTAHSHTFGFT